MRVLSLKHRKQGPGSLQIPVTCQNHHVQAENSTNLTDYILFPVWFTSYFISFYVTLFKAQGGAYILRIIHYFRLIIVFDLPHTRHYRRLALQTTISSGRMKQLSNCFFLIQSVRLAQKKQPHLASALSAVLNAAFSVYSAIQVTLPVGCRISRRPAVAYIFRSSVYRMASNSPRCSSQYRIARSVPRI